MSDDEDALAALTRRMADLGAKDPAAWAASEVGEGIPQQARYLVLRRAWADAMAPWRDPRVLRRYGALDALIRQGADAALLAEAVRGVVLDTVSAMIMIVDEGNDPDAPPDAPKWALMEVSPGHGLTGRRIDGLHESLLGVDPTGQEAADFR
jgi:hypothetical protein